MPLSVQTLIQDRYRIEALLGQGGMGAVYRAWDTRLKLTCAIKENIASQQYQTIARELAQQFEHEATILAALHHPNLPRVTNYFLINDDQYLVMDYVEGEDLAGRLIRSGRLPESEVVAMMSQICDAVTYLHTRPGGGIIHRDIKPANLKITRDDQPMLVDFGLSKQYDPNLSTVAGARGWSSGFSPPEQYDRGTDARSDQYALAATMLSLLTGQVPPDALERQLGYTSLKPIRSLVPEISIGVEEALLRAMSLSPADRFDSVASFKAALTKDLGRTLPAPTEPAPTKPSLTVSSARAALVSRDQHSYLLTKTRNLIGRRNRKTGDLPDIDLSEERDGDTVSRKHAWLSWLNGDWHLEPHVGHKNIVKVNGRVIAQAGARVCNNDQIQIGGVVLRFQVGSDQ